MNRMIKKATAWLAMFVIVFAIIGCGTAETSQSTEGTGADTEAVASNASEPESEAAEETADLEKDEAAANETADSEKDETTEEGTPDSGEDEMAEQETVLIDDGHEKADDAVQNMLVGWNLGNSLDATGDWIPQSAGGAVEKFETAWGNPVTPPTLMPKLKSLGFQAVRIPITWNHHFDDEGNIDAEWMARVKEIVDWAMEADLYCIINIHHDTGAADYAWLRSTKANYEKNNVIFAKLWEQIATEFKDYPDMLVFEGFNEMLDEKPEWSNPNAESIEVINLYNQLFVDTVRKTGGNNETRNLVCCTYAAATTSSAINGFKMPEDCAQGHLIAEVHFYVPYEFITDEGITWTTPIKEYTDYVENQIDEVFARLKGRFTDKNVPLIIGEFACNDKGNTEDRVKWYTHVIEKANEINTTCFMWDNGMWGNEKGDSMGHIDRVGNEDAFPQIVEACVETAK